MDDEQPRISTEAAATLASRLDRPIVLIGMMGVGKSSLGKRLAALLDCPFFDADTEIEQSAQMSIPEIFAQFGEAYFRDGERRVIARLLDEGSGVRVIATGGGAFINDETRALILAKGVAVWLDSDIDTLVERTSRRDNRPLLRQGDPREILTRLRNERAPFYALAPIHIISGNAPHAQTLSKVLQGLNQWL